VSQVRGFADQRLRKPDAPLDPANRRVSLIVQYLMKPEAANDAPVVAEGAKAPARKAPEGKSLDAKAANAKALGTVPPAKTP
jgi:hypothetical protein